MRRSRTVSAGLENELPDTGLMLNPGGISLTSVAGKKVGVFVGGPIADHAFHNTGTTPNDTSVARDKHMLANNISHFFNMKGPSIAVNTASSTSLAVVHTACQSIKAGEIQSKFMLSQLPTEFAIAQNPTRFVEQSSFESCITVSVT